MRYLKSPVQRPCYRYTTSFRILSCYGLFKLFDCTYDSDCDIISKIFSIKLILCLRHFGGFLISNVCSELLLI